MMRKVERWVGGAIVVYAVWLLSLANVDVGATTGPTNCGPGALQVLAFGP
ncbi:MAG: hypothetical protein ACOYL9_01810 [Ilumatobacteraceae bacterium]